MLLQKNRTWTGRSTLQPARRPALRHGGGRRTLDQTIKVEWPILRFFLAKGGNHEPQPAAFRSLQLRLAKFPSSEDPDLGHPTESAPIRISVAPTSRSAVAGTSSSAPGAAGVRDNFPVSDGFVLLQKTGTWTGRSTLQPARRPALRHGGGRRTLDQTIKVEWPILRFFLAKGGNHEPQPAAFRSLQLRLAKFPSSEDPDLGHPTESAPIRISVAPTSRSAVAGTSSSAPGAAGVRDNFPVSDGFVLLQKTGTWTGRSTLQPARRPALRHGGGRRTLDQTIKVEWPILRFSLAKGGNHEPQPAAFRSLQLRLAKFPSSEDPDLGHPTESAPIRISVAPTSRSAVAGTFPSALGAAGVRDNFPVSNRSILLQKNQTWTGRSTLQPAGRPALRHGGGRRTLDQTIKAGWPILRFFLAKGEDHEPQPDVFVLSNFGFQSLPALKIQTWAILPNQSRIESP